MFLMLFYARCFRNGIQASSRSGVTSLNLISEVKFVSTQVLHMFFRVTLRL